MSAEVAQPRSSTRSSPNVPPIDLRHMTSATILGPGDNRRASQHLQPTVRKGSRSPSSIPSSPTSVHSSSSAIFERDIEPIHIPPSAPLGPGGAKKDPHRIPRSKNTETLEQSVPSVLDSAASILASMSGEDGDSIAVIAPAPLSSSSLLEQAGTARSRLSGSGFASPIGSFRSRSPSPSPRSGGNRNSLLLNIPPPNALPHQHVATPVPSLSPPASASASAPSPTSAPPTARQFDVVPMTPTGDSAHNTGTARAPSSTTSAANKRLSFVSYTDLLSSTPTTTQPLSTLTSPRLLTVTHLGRQLRCRP
ncbi:hypothetical protein MVEN_00837900 [Mycena venus]|uniref:Uncharacterized protein n=1 Tax=Mycena venus TaxID=2733690 RepID=A0A8H6YBD2_9AGAR|nr:hypothetical protein MVEN_00837900 [Mycena venus]